MAKVKGLVVDSGKREDYKGTLSELDKARRDYEYGVTLDELEEDEEEATFNGVNLGNIIEPKEDGNRPFAYLEFYDDAKEEKLALPLNFKFKSDKPVIFNGSKIFPLIQAITGDKESTYFKLNYKVLQATIKDIKSITIKGVYVDGDYPYTGFEVVDLQMK